MRVNVNCFSVNFKQKRQGIQEKKNILYDCIYLKYM